MSAANIALLDAGPEELTALGPLLPPTVTLSSGRAPGAEQWPADHLWLSDYQQVYAPARISGAEITPWLGHPGLKIVPDFQPETLGPKIIAEINGAGGAEIERKFLLSPEGQVVDWGTVLSAERPSCQVVISQCYLSPPGAEEEVRLRAWHLPGVSFYFQTSKKARPGTGGRERQEIEQPLTADQYQQKKSAAADAPEINKRRIVFWDCGHKWELDQIGARWFLEIELFSAEQALLRPAEIDSWTEVTGDPRWKNRSLAR